MRYSHYSIEAIASFAVFSISTSSLRTRPAFSVVLDGEKCVHVKEMMVKETKKTLKLLRVNNLFDKSSTNYTSQFE